jgi:transaldolase
MLEGEMEMADSYFGRMKAETPTRVWVNNPTAADIGLALAQGAVGCTTNPGYAGGLLKRAPEEIGPVIAECVRLSDDDATVADLVQQRLVARVADRFRPVFKANGGRLGFVSIQGAPEADTDTEHILEEAHAGLAVGPNTIAKIPATRAGLDAFDELVGEGSPTIVTEVFSLAQLIETCERYIQISARTHHRPPFFMSPITGILGDRLKFLAARDRLEINDADMELAGVAVSRACYRLARTRNYPVTLLCGGSRIPFDLTGLVGAELHVTINWSTFAEVIDSGQPLVSGIDQPIDPAVISRLQATFEECRLALRTDGLGIDDFADFGPVQHFRNNFIGGWNQLLGAIAAERATLLPL